MGAITLVVLEMVAIGFFIRGFKHEGAICLVLAYFLYSPVSANVFQGASASVCAIADSCCVFQSLIAGKSTLART